MSIKVLIFAKLRDDLGVGQDTFDYVAQETADELFSRLQEKHSRTLSKQGVRVAINEGFASWTTLVTDNDEVAFIPPVAGG